MNGKFVREIAKKGEAATWTTDNKTRCDGSKPSDTTCNSLLSFLLGEFKASIYLRPPETWSPISNSLRLFEPAI